MRNNLNLAEKGTEVLYAYFLLLAWKTEGFFDFQIHKYKYKCCMRTLLVFGRQKDFVNFLNPDLRAAAAAAPKERIAHDGNAFLERGSLE